MAVRPPTLQDLARRRAKKPFKFPKFTPARGSVEIAPDGFILERDGIILPGPMILSTENGHIIFGDPVSLID
jgi:hypothetical protein